MKYTDPNALPYPAPEEFAEGGRQLQDLAERLQALLAEYDTLHGQLTTRPMGVRRRSSTDTGYSNAGFSAIWNDDLVLSGGVTASSTAGVRTPTDASLYPSIWACEATLFTGPAGGSFTANSARGVEINVNWVDPTSGEELEERYWAKLRAGGITGTTIEGVTGSFLVRLTQASDIDVYVPHSNVADLELYVNSKIAVTFIGLCD